MGDPQDPVDSAPGAAVESHQLGPQEGVGHDGRVVGQPAQQEGHHHGHDHLHGPVLLEAACAKQPRHRDAVTRQHNQQRDQEAKNVQDEAYWNPPGGWAAQVVHPVAYLCLRLGVECLNFVEERRQCQSAAHGPDGGTQEPAAHALPPAQALAGAHDDHVSVYADASQEDDAGVEVGLHDQVDELAHDAAEDPAVDQRRRQERDGEGHEAVSHRQVHQVDIWGRQSLSAGADHPAHQQVSGDGQAEDDHQEEAEDSGQSGILVQ